jgi:hypothetical protein
MQKHRANASATTNGQDVEPRHPPSRAIHAQMRARRMFVSLDDLQRVLSMAPSQSPHQMWGSLLNSSEAGTAGDAANGAKMN